MWGGSSQVLRPTFFWKWVGEPDLGGSRQGMGYFGKLTTFQSNSYIIMFGYKCWARGNENLKRLMAH